MILSNRLFLFAVCWLLCLPIYAQDIIPDEISAAPSISSISNYGLGEGLAATCLTNTFLDHKGRLWINPCQEGNIGPPLSFFQYDGRRSTFFNFQPDWITQEQDTLVWQLIGGTPEGFLFGMDYGKSVAFLWHPDSKEQYFFTFDSEEYLHSMALGAEGKVLVLTYEMGAYHFYHLQHSQGQKQFSIPLEFEREINPKFHPPFVVQGENIWFYHQKEGILRVNLEDKKSEVYSWKELIGKSIEANSLWNKKGDPFHWRMLALNYRSLFLYLGSYEGFFLLDVETLALTPVSHLNLLLPKQETSEWIGVWANQDSKNNILITLVDGTQNRGEKAVPFQATLMDTQGHIFDYTNLLREGRNMAQYRTIAIGSGTYFSRDFHKELLWASPGGLEIITLQPNLDIAAFPLDFGTRFIGELDKQHLLVNTDASTKILDLANASYSSFFGDKAKLLSPLVQTPDGKLWVSSNQRGLISIEPGSNSLQAFPIDLLFEKFIFTKDQSVILLSREGEIYVYHLDTRDLVPFLPKETTFSIKSVTNELYLDGEDILWIAAQNGLWRIDVRHDSVFQFDLPLLRNENIMCIHEGEGNELWLGTGKKGVLILNTVTKEVEQISKVNGLSNNIVVGILADGEGNRWVSTFDGISVISPEREVLFDLSELNGLTHSEFNRTSYAKLPDGRLAFGGVQGINILNPTQILAAYANKEPLQIFLTSLEYFHKQEKKNKTVLGTLVGEEAIHIPATNRYLFLDFALSEYVELDKHTFAYRILPLNARNDSTISTPWNSLGAISELTLNDLPVGKYVIQVRGVNHRSEQTEEPLEVFIEVEDFFYRTWWFYLLCTLPFIFGAWAWLYRNRTEKQRLREEVERRTAQILKDKQTIERQAEELRELDKAKSRFFTNISHEFRTPLTIISGMITQIHNHPEQWLDKGAELIQRNSNQLLSLINQILDLRKLESNTLKLQLIQGDIVAYIRHIVDAFEPIAHTNHIRIHFLTSMDDMEMDYDPDKIMQIVSNLLSNAIKYMPDEGGDIYVQITKASEKGQELLSVHIKDTGKGISAEALPHIFDRFYQAENFAYQKPYGSGIGLSLTKELVQLIEGHIEVKSTEGKGTEFLLHFPIQRSTDINSPTVNYPKLNISHRSAAENDQAKSHSSESKRDNSLPETYTQLPTLLIVEDNLDIQMYLRSCLEKHYQLFVANDGQEGIDMAIEYVPELIVSDVMMPKKDGFTLCDTLKNHELTSHIPIILLTAKSSFESKISGLKKGADAYLTKPFEPEELLVRLEQLLTLRNKLQEKYGNILAQKETASQEGNQLDEQFLQKIRDIVQEHISDEEFNVPKFCKAVGLGRTQLHNKIKALTGQSTSIFIRNIRLHKAKELLQTTDLNVSEVGYEVGISNPYYFSRLYKELFGVSPKEEVS